VHCHHGLNPFDFAQGRSRSSTRRCAVKDRSAIQVSQLFTSGLKPSVFSAPQCRPKGLRHPSVVSVGILRYAQDEQAIAKARRFLVVTAGLKARSIALH
jgi:hypothetical protein